jgi:uncharacterized protein (DUF885 family)
MATGGGTQVQSNASLETFSAEFWRWRAATQPFSPDDISRLERPSMLRDWSATAVASRRKELASFEDQWQNMQTSPWSVSDQVDYRLLGSALARVRWELNVLRRWERDPNFYLEQTLTALQEALTVPAPYDGAQSRELLERIENIPAILDAAKQNLNNPPAPFTTLAIRALEDIRKRLDSMAVTLQPYTTLSPSQLGRAGDHAADALEAYREWLRELVPSLPGETAIGHDAYVFFLSRVALMPFTPEELLAMGRQELERAIAFEQIERNRNVNVASLEIAPDMEAQMRRSIAAEEGIRKFLVQQKILTVPDGIAHYTIAPIPEYLKALDGFGEMIDFTSSSRLNENARRYLDPPSERLGYFWLATAKDPRPDMVHEGVPGHYFQFALSWRHPNAIRRHFYDSGANEGIAFYAEEMMLQAGLFDDSPRSREIIYNFARLRALRVEVDIKLAIGAFDIEQAADYLERVVPMDGETARHEAAFFATGPGQAITYQIGKLQVLKFLADARLKFGKDFNLREFHDSLWLNGNVPIALQRWELLGLRDEIERLDQIAAGR